MNRILLCLESDKAYKKGTGMTLSGHLWCYTEVCESSRTSEDIFCVWRGRNVKNNHDEL